MSWDVAGPTRFGARFPARCFVGVDIKGARIWQAATAALGANLDNVMFLRAEVAEIDRYFTHGAIDEIWLPFPDPFPKKKRSPNRLTSPRFLKVYRRLLTPVGRLHLKTDDFDLFEYTLQTVQEVGGEVEVLSMDVRREFSDHEVLSITTTYGKHYLTSGKKIKYVRCAFPIEA